MVRRLALIVACLVPACSTGAEQVDIAALAAEIPRLMEAADVPGLSIAVLEHGEISWTGAFGTVNDSATNAVNAETLFEAASLSKPVFGYIVLRLVDRGEFDLDHPLFEMLEYPRLAHDRRYERITARTVLTHGTGLPNWGDEQLTLAFDPGTAFGYSGEGFVFLQKVVEEVTGLSLEELAQREVFEPLGMTRSSFVWQERFAPNAAYARDLSWNVGPITRWSDGNAAASLLTTATDYARFVAAVLNGTGLSNETWSAYLSPERSMEEPPTETSTYFGLGIGVDDGPAGRTFFHSGNNDDRFISYMVGYPGRGLGFVYFANVGDGTSIAESLAAHVIRDDRPTDRHVGSVRYDDPERLALKSVRRAAVAGGLEAARETFQSVRAGSSRLSLQRAVELAGFLTARGLAPAAVDVLRAAEEDAPDSVTAVSGLARALLAAGEHQAAIEAYRRSMELGPTDVDDTDRRIRWIEERLAVMARPIALPLSILESYAGQYQERQITLRDGRLYYRRGTGTEHALTPMAQDLFALEGVETFRVRFVRNGTGPASRIVGIDIDGWSNEMERSIEPR
jgi:CubicO group peptidase (beta-lactamase class C family)